MTPTVRINTPTSLTPGEPYYDINTRRPIAGERKEKEMTEYTEKSIRQTRGPILRFKGRRIAQTEFTTGRSEMIELEIWETEHGALIPVSIGEMGRQNRLDVRAAVIESPTLDADDPMLDRLIEQRGQAMRFAVMDFFDWTDRAKQMVVKQLDWDLSRRVA